MRVGCSQHFQRAHHGLAGQLALPRSRGKLAMEGRLEGGTAREVFINGVTQS